MCKYTCTCIWTGGYPLLGEDTFLSIYMYIWTGGYPLLGVDDQKLVDVHLMQSCSSLTFTLNPKVVPHLTITVVCLLGKSANISLNDYIDC